MTEDVQRPLGRRHQVDDRDALYIAGRATALPKRLVLPARSHTYRYWHESFNVDQTGDTCTWNALAHALGDSPRTHTLTALDGLELRPDALGVYRSARGYVSAQSGQAGFRGLGYDLAQGIDEWDDTPPAGGTSARATCKVAQASGLIGEYLWLTTVDDVATALLELGPVLFGCTWHDRMMYREDGDLVREDDTIVPEGPAIGGHEVCLSGVNTRTRRIRIQTWGMHLWMSFDTVDALLGEWADAAIITEPGG